MAKHALLILGILTVVLFPGWLRAQTKGPDFNGDGKVDFDDFFLFAATFGSKAPQDLVKFDLDDSGAVDLGDFFLFAADFGKMVLIGQPPIGAQLVLAPGDTMALVPAGEFTMGTADTTVDRLLKENPSWDRSMFEGERPAHKVVLSAFYIDKYEVTNAQYQAFVKAMRRVQSVFVMDTRFNAPNQPIVGVTWFDAHDYCEWAGKRLPTEAEWEKAARGTDGRTYPWGNSFDGRRLNFADRNTDYSWSDKGVDDGYKYTAPVGSYPSGASPYGALDMAGNAWEWVSSKYRPYPYSATDGREVIDDSVDSRVARGGSCLNAPQNVRAAFRSWNNPADRTGIIGLRCARNP